MTLTRNFLRRYTDLLALIHLLRTKAIGQWSSSKT
jgi:hypothetical protein